MEKSVSQLIIELLEKHKGEVFSKSEIRDLLDINDKRATEHLRKLIRHTEILFERISVRIAKKIYGNSFKRGLRLYYID